MTKSLPLSTLCVLTQVICLTGNAVSPSLNLMCSHIVICPSGNTTTQQATSANSLTCYPRIPTHNIMELAFSLSQNSNDSRSSNSVLLHFSWFSSLNTCIRHLFSCEALLLLSCKCYGYILVLTCKNCTYKSIYPSISPLRPPPCPNKIKIFFFFFRNYVRFPWDNKLDALDCVKTSVQKLPDVLNLTHFQIRLLLG